MSVAAKACAIHTAKSEADVRQCWPAFHELRPHPQVEEGYQIVNVKEGEKVVAAAGYRLKGLLVPMAGAERQ